MQSKDFNPPLAVLNQNPQRIFLCVFTIDAALHSAQDCSFVNSQYALSMSLFHRCRSRGWWVLMKLWASFTPVMLGVPQKGKAMCSSRSSTLRHRPTCWELRFRGCPLWEINKRQRQSQSASVVLQFNNLNALGAVNLYSPSWRDSAIAERERSALGQKPRRFAKWSIFCSNANFRVGNKTYRSAPCFQSSISLTSKEGQRIVSVVSAFSAWTGHTV